jgi:hypothetical protein
VPVQQSFNYWVRQAGIVGSRVWPSFEDYRQSKLCYSISAQASHRQDRNYEKTKIIECRLLTLMFRDPSGQYAEEFSDDVALARRL